MEKQTESSNSSRKPGKNIWKTLITIVKVFTFLFLMGVLFAGGAATGYVASLVKSDPVRSYNEINSKLNTNNLTGFAYFRDNTLIGQLRTDEDRRLVTADKVSPHLIDAIISTEDKYFYEHHGVVPSAIMRAGIQQVTGSSVQTGGSTLTQQLIKQTILTPKQTMDRKFKEIFLALRVERMFTKEQILNAYINKMYFGKSANGSNVYGVEAAARGIFGVDAKDLNIAQSAYLAGMLQAPSNYIPFRKSGLKAGLQRQKVVLTRMLENNKITRAEYEDALTYDIAAHLAKPKEKAYEKYPYLMMEIEQQAAEALVNQDIAQNPDLKKENTRALIEEKRKEILQGGYHIYTTIDQKLYTKMQAIGSDPNNFGPNRTYWVNGKKFSNQPEQVGATLIQNKTGAILGMIEGRDFDSQQYSHTMHPRQPGSSMKPIAAYAPALEEGLVQPASVIDDGPININGWQPKNDGGNWHGAVTARQALTWSYNIPAIKTYLKTGIKPSLAYVRKMGVTTLTDVDNEVASGVIGGLTYGLTVQQITNAYATFPNKGNYIPAYMIERIENSDHQVVYQHQINSTRVFSPQTAWLITDMLRNVVHEGTASGVIPDYIGNEDVAGKTGTTQDDKDKWFVGYSPDVSIGVWVGYDTPTTIPKSRSKDALNIWGKIFSTVTQTEPELSPASHKMEMPDGIVRVTVDKRNGKLATSDVSKAGYGITDYFNEKYVPTEYSNEVTTASPLPGTTAPANPNGGSTPAPSPNANNQQQPGNQQNPDNLPSPDNKQSGTNTEQNNSTVPGVQKKSTHQKNTQNHEVQHQ
ncbi:transglycosylase domain-containing protein [Aneurinibacillus terranovensis]|uniref:transglycosylase domain-containing protein n=1 Tax=Aneurinibacillus terranovensis TaxID=278991 RepID=UPI000406C0B9|nr:transglycosylase domain-containing protein [Aneurinibacillus terranovensis]